MLQINFNQGKYEIKGDLIQENTRSLLSYFEMLLQQDSKIVLSLKDVTKIDHYGLQVFRKLYKISLITNKKFQVLAKVNEKVKWILKDPILQGIVKRK